MYTLENPDLKINIDKINELKKEIENTTIVAATKYITADTMVDLYNAGIRDFGENRVDSFIKKRFILRNLDCKWHFIGHLQRNKAKLVINDIDYLHSLDSIELCKVINKLRDKPLDCFIEVKLSDSETKNGVLASNLKDFIDETKEYKMVNIVGLMTMTEPQMTTEEKEKLFIECKKLADSYGLKLLSMGMSDDYKEAISAGATHIRLGRILFK